MKPPRVKLPLPIIITTICVLLFIAVLYAERLSFPNSTSIFKFKTCTRKHTKSKSNDKKSEEVFANASWTDDRFDFDPEECNVANGKWVFNSSSKPLYSDSSCPYIDRQFSCVKNGRNDSDYLHWEWQPEDCTLPPFNPELALKKLQGKRLLFVGDSLQRNQWESFVCLVQGVIPEKKKSMKRGRVHSVFKAKEYNATIEFYWAPFLVESNSDIHIIGDPKKRIIKVDEITERAKNWTGVDILVFNTYVWWMSGLRIKALWGSFANGEEGYEELDTPVAYKFGLRTWANWVDSTIDPNKTRNLAKDKSIKVKKKSFKDKNKLAIEIEKNQIKNKLVTENGENKSTRIKEKSTMKKVKTLTINKMNKHSMRGVIACGKPG
ncbi:Protein trichome birefringence-like 3 [Vigna angularis]|uniref:Protein trichome birefringence-like 3 n=1 Tax=Phaseolus angularis TaxID=3914 RepID=A0A8T0JRY7_PHAAN|nr:Protein trichome birefringence-like 3 [Vigna angularis]